MQCTRAQLQAGVSGWVRCDTMCVCDVCTFRKWITVRNAACIRVYNRERSHTRDRASYFPDFMRQFHVDVADCNRYGNEHVTIYRFRTRVSDGQKFAPRVSLFGWFQMPPVMYGTV